MPVFFFIDPEMLRDRQVSYVRNVTLSYTFFPTDEDEDYLDDENDEDAKAAAWRSGNVSIIQGRNQVILTDSQVETIQLHHLM